MLIFVFDYTTQWYMIFVDQICVLNLCYIINDHKSELIHATDTLILNTILPISL